MSSSTASESQHAEKPSPEQVREAAKAVGSFLANQTYAVVGGAACSLLGSQRVTEDVDIVVPRGATKETRNALKNQPTYFDSDPRVEVEILAPPSLFRETFDASTPFVLIGNPKVLKPTLILNAKCNAISGRATEGKKASDAEDIKFCLQWCHGNGVIPTAEEVPNADADFVRRFASVYGGKEDWAKIGYNFETGKFTGRAE
ncbi:uncharacterized protein RAG0_16571 [Rhynchosporium agropyri]|uniref:Uncharacterized protein n=1 Tax=Rhynchosporium agropyri TaxID=914238 RepID=A0A1E1LR32_9HELO|nr:uncharacterized protein RAG0_16571 [Rhynchosporium agropyri]